MRTIVDGFDFSEDDYIDALISKLTVALKTFGISVNLEYDDYEGEGSISLLKPDSIEANNQHVELFDVTFSLPKARYEQLLRVLGIYEEE